MFIYADGVRPPGSGAKKKNNTYTDMCTYNVYIICIDIYIYIERERYTYMHIHTYTCTYTCTYIHNHVIYVLHIGSGANKRDPGPKEDSLILRI